MVRPLALAASALLFAAPAGAQDLAALCRKAMHPAMGSWSEFTVVGGREDGATMRMSVVGSESHGDTAYMWIEMAMKGMSMGPGGKMSGVVKMLVANYGPGMGAPRSVVAKFGTLPAMQMPVGGPTPEGAGSTLQKCQQAKSLGWETVVVPAGSFRALHVQDADGHGDAWVDADLPLALVKAQMGSDGGEMVLAAHGHGATTAITETPQPFNPQLMMQMMSGGNH